MAANFSLDDLLDFLAHASERGLIPAATAQSLAVACRNVFGVLNTKERTALPVSDLDSVIKRFTNKRTKDFNPSSLTEYGRRVHRAVELYLQWLNDPTNFTVKTRATNATRRKDQRATSSEAIWGSPREHQTLKETPSGYGSLSSSRTSGYDTAFPIRPGHVITVGNIPYDLSTTEAKRLADFVKMLVAEIS